MRIKIAFLLALSPLVLFGSDVSIGDSDFIERTINFVIFVAILWYLLANRIKMMLKNRQESIAEQLNSIQDKLEHSRTQKQEALKALEDAKCTAKEIVDIAKKEAEIIAQNMQAQCKNDMEIMKKNHKELVEFEHKKAKKAVIGEILDELLDDKNMKLSKDDYINILLKGAA